MTNEDMPLGWKFVEATLNGQAVLIVDPTWDASEVDAEAAQYAPDGFKIVDFSSTPDAFDPLVFFAPDRCVCSFKMEEIESGHSHSVYRIRREECTFKLSEISYSGGVENPASPLSEIAENRKLLIKREIQSARQKYEAGEISFECLYDRIWLTICQGAAYYANYEAAHGAHPQEWIPGRAKELAEPKIQCLQKTLLFFFKNDTATEQDWKCAIGRLTSLKSAK